MRRTWLLAVLLMSLAAPAAAQVEGTAGANVNVGGGTRGRFRSSVARRGFLLGARLVVESPGDSGAISSGFDPDDTPIEAGILPRYYLGYRLGKLGFVLGLHISSVSYTDERPREDDERSLFLFALAPQVLYELVGSGGVALDLFAGPIFGFGSYDRDPGADTSIFGLGLDVGVRLIGYLLAGFGLHADVGMHFAFVNTEREEEDNNDDETDTGVIGFYGALGFLGTL